MKINTTLKLEYIFYVALYIMTFAKAFGLNRSDAIYNILFGVSCLLLILKMLTIKTTKANWLRLVLIFVSCVFILLSSHETTLLFTVMFLFASQNIDFEKCIKGCMKLYWTAVPLKILLSFMGIVEGGYKPIYATVDGVTQIVDYTYGYGYITPNVLFASGFMAIILYLYVKKSHLSMIHIVFCSTLITGIYMMTKCRTGIIVYGVLLFLILVNKYIKSGEKYIKLCCCGLLIVSFIIGTIFPIIYTEEAEIMAFFDRLFTGRLNLANTSLLNSGISLFGIGDSSLDILFMHSLINNGIVGFLLLILGESVLLATFLKNKNFMGAICISIMIFYSTMEQFPLNIVMNPFILYMGTNVLFKDTIG